jgi:hypothetical protein
LKQRRLKVRGRRQTTEEIGIMEYWKNGMVRKATGYGFNLIKGVGSRGQGN